MRRTASLFSLVCLVGVLLVIPGVVSGSHRFGDVPDSHLFHAPIGWLADHGITKGCNPPVNDRFCPDEPVTRGQMAGFLVRTFDFPTGSSARFDDVQGHVFENAIGRLVGAQITFGCNPPANDLFCPDDYVTRGQMAAFLVRSVGYTDGSDANLFSDDDGHVFEGAIDRLATAGVSRGCNPPTNSRFCPNDYVTRGQMAAFLNRSYMVGESCVLATVEHDDCVALIAFFRSTNGMDWKDRDGWVFSPDTCSWYGISCEQDRVTGLSSSQNHLTGSLPPEIGDLQMLTQLSVRDNNLIGPIPPEIGQLVNLTSLHLSENPFNVEIPTELAKLTKLTRLSLSGGQFKGPIPPGLGGLNSLEFMFLGRNELAGPIPSEFGDLSALKVLDLGNNHLNGPIPVELAALSNLIELELDNNQLTGPIPPQLGNLTNLDNLVLLGNQLTGAIPVELAQLSNLRYLRLSANHLTGPIPTELGNLSNLIWLHLYGNQLTGTIPTELGDLLKMGNLRLSDNNLTGTIPKEIGNLQGLYRLHLNNNQLVGEVPTEIQTGQPYLELLLRGQAGCLYTNDTVFEAWLDSRDPLWNDGCP